MYRKKFTINTSITDFAPLFLDLEYLFRGLKNTGIDGIELVLGVKSRWSVDKIKHLSEKYKLPIASIHQPVWSGLGVAFDEHFFAIAIQLGAKVIVCHPLPHFSFHDKEMREYLKKLSLMQEKTGVSVLLENMSPKYGMKVIDTVFPLHKDTTNVELVVASAQEYNLKFTLDIDHLQKERPDKEPWFKDVFSRIGNIHLSSFKGTQEHLPLYLGNFRSKEFLQTLREKDYQGLLTFEIYYPKFINFFGYNFAAIKKSVEYIKSFPE